MSKVQLQGNVSGTGIFTIASPNSNIDRTLSLPDNTGTLITQNSQPSFASTIGVGGATPAASGAGITFPATQSASTNANTLDDYEEGTWSPTDQSGAGLSLSGMSGYYIKIGTNVFATIIGVFPSNSNGNQCRISLPFTTITIPGFSAQAAGSMLRASGSTTISYCSGGNIFMEFYVPNAFTSQTNANMSSVSIIASLTYQASA